MKKTGPMISTGYLIAARSSRLFDKLAEQLPTRHLCSPSDRPNAVCGVVIDAVMLGGNRLVVIKARPMHHELLRKKLDIIKTYPNPRQIPKWEAGFLEMMEQAGFYMVNGCLTQHSGPDGKVIRPQDPRQLTLAL